MIYEEIRIYHPEAPEWNDAVLADAAAAAAAGGDAVAAAAAAAAATAAAPPADESVPMQ